ncbi:MAG: hypothetical protein HQM13_20505 [SAR324 cluster bacterium]|nr:hypothetical protein [SAR324 cluster bacterium]
MKRQIGTILTGIAFLILTPGLWSLENEYCLDCHEGEESNEIILSRFESSIHGDSDCTECHTDITEKHEEEDEPVAAKVNCLECHDEDNIREEYENSVHGKAVLERDDHFAPTCASCHGNHYILPHDSPQSSTYVMNIPATCGSCHKEGTEMTATHQIDQKNVVANYSMSIHGEGLFKRGLIITAVCTSCHGSHNILSHENPESRINRENLPGTCMQCHAQIEQVHEKVVQGHLWEREPGKVPVCVECHSPHKIRQVIYDEPITDSTCLNCHSQPDINIIRDGQSVSMHKDRFELDASVHAEISCVRCHFDIDPGAEIEYKDIEPGVPVHKNVNPVDCSVCHAEEVTAYSNGIHGKLLAENDPDAPACSFCHGTHDILSKKDQRSPTFAQSVPILCAKCHQEGNQSAARGNSSESNIVRNYTMSVHGKGLFQSGLLVTATCASCHSPHSELPVSDPKSTVFPGNIAKTCSTCHFGIFEQFNESIHSATVSKSDQPLPVCNDCHSSHTIQRVNDGNFRFAITNQCGGCHKDLTESYFDTFHGKVSKLGESGAAKCYDCHGSHNILPRSNPRSTLHRENIVNTCKQCHPDSNRKFTGYLTHATHHDREKYPILYYSFWFMTVLLIGTLGFFGLHSLLWLTRSLIVKSSQSYEAEEQARSKPKEEQYYRRFRPIHSILHLMVIVSFLGLALTGMTIKFPDMKFFSEVSHLLGGPQVTGVIHRICAVITFAYFAIHLFMLAKSFKQRQITLKGLLKEEYSMVPLKRDLVAMKENFLWFIGKGPQPKFGRWTYWEKFDYLAVFWGVAIIGLTGLVLWFPEFATLFLPGWVINVATVVHSDEALLATGFIFSIHFFNTHFRPGKFPMDPVIFTGRIPLSELKEERPVEYQQLLESGQLEKYLVGPPSKRRMIFAKVFGLSFLATGLMIVIAIVYAMIISYL